MRGLRGSDGGVTVRHFMSVASGGGSWKVRVNGTRARSFILMRLFLFSLVTAFVVAACTGADVARPVDGPFVVLHIVGSVRHAGGAPVAGATLDVRARNPGSCSGAYADGQVTADPEGRFALTLGNWNAPRDVCVWVAVAPPTGSAASADTITVQPARLQVTADTVRVDIVLPLPPAT